MWKKAAIAKGGITWISYIVILHASLLFKRTGGKTDDQGTEIHGAGWQTDPDLPYRGHTPLERRHKGQSLQGNSRKKDRERGEEKEKMKAKGTHAGFLFLCHIGRGDTDTNHVLPLTKDQKCYRAFVITSCFQQIGNNFSKYGLVFQSWMGSVSFHWEYILVPYM